MGSPCLFTRQQALKLGYFYWLRVKNSNPLLTELSRCYLKHTKFYLEHKASFIQISSIASFNSFLIACCGDIALFRTVPWLAWSPRLDPNTPNTKLFSPKKSCSRSRGCAVQNKGITLRPPLTVRVVDQEPSHVSVDSFSLSWGWTSTEMMNSLADFRVQYRIYPLRIGCHGMLQIIFSGTRVIMYTAHKRIFRWCTRLENGWE